MSSITGGIASRIVDISLCRTHRFNKATNILITEGDMCMVDTGTTPKSFKSSPASAGQKSTIWVMALETVTVAMAKDRFSGCHKGPVIANLTGNIGLYQQTQNDDANIGKVIAFVASTVATPTAAEVLNVRDDYLRRIGPYWGHPHEFAQGVFSDHTAGQFNNLGVVWLGGNS